MRTLVLDASVAIKWVVEEEGTTEALALRREARLQAPELLVAECANILWKKVRKDELTVEQAMLSARLLQAADVELFPTRSLLASALGLAIDLEHPAYDCLYLALAVATAGVFVTADKSLVRKVLRSSRRELAARVAHLSDAVASSRP